MSERDNGGPAFPVVAELNVRSEGMTLRDWFAGQALAGMLAHGPHQDLAVLSSADLCAHIAGGAYDLAAAMLEARK